MLVTGAAAVFAPSAGASTPSGVPSLYAVYTMNCQFSLVDDSGNKVTSIAPGTYQVVVSTPVMFKLVDNQYSATDFTGCKGYVQFQLAGPGVNLATTLDFGCDASYELPGTYFKPNATYTAQDLNQPSVTRTTFSTLASGTPTAPASPYGATTGKGSTQQDVVGSALAATLHGTVAGTLGANGSVTLTTKGKSVSTLRAGRYRFSITDRSTKRGLSLTTAKGSSRELTGSAFVGTKAAIVTLKAGRWYVTSGAGKKHEFNVV